MAYAAAVKRNDYIDALVRRAATPTPSQDDNHTVSLSQADPAGTTVRPGGDLSRAFVEAFGERWQFAYCVWLREGGNVGYVVSATNDLGPWQLHKARWPGDEGLYAVFISWGYTDPHDFGQSTDFTVRYTALNGWGMWVGARYC